MLESHPLDRFGYSGWLLELNGDGLAGVDMTEAAGPGAALTKDHERGCALVPALGDVGAACLLAHGDKVEFPHRLLDLAVGRSGIERHPHPFRLSGFEPHRVSRDPGLGESTQQPHRRAVGLFSKCKRWVVIAVTDTLSADRRTGAFTTGERGEVAVRHPPGDIGPID